MYEEKNNGYFKNIRKELLELIPNENRGKNILEIGAGGGDTLVYAKAHGYANMISAIELCKVDNSFQVSNEFDQFIIGNIETMQELPFENNSFDVIICGDVLEHLVDPYSVIDRLRKVLKPDGVFVVSLPNIRQIQILKQIIIDGTFAYADAGILDRTHLRFFCKKDMLKLFEQKGFEIKKIISNSNLIGKTTKIINKFTFNIFDQFLAAQYYLVVSKKC